MLNITLGNLNRQDNISIFRSGVNNGMNDVSFFNGQAERLSKVNNNSSTTFGIAAASANERAGFSSTMLEEFKGDLFSAFMQYESMLKGMLSSNGKSITIPETNETSFMQNAEVSSQVEKPLNMANPGVLQQQPNKKKDNSLTIQVYGAIDQLQSELMSQLSNLEDVNSDADIQFKTLKETSEAKRFIADSNYYAHNYKLEDTDFNNTGNMLSAQGDTGGTNTSKESGKTSGSKLKILA